MILKQAKDVSYDAAIGSILRTLPSIIVSLERDGTERSEPTPVGLAKFVKTYYFVACCHFLHQILPHISHLSLIFQREDIDLSLIRPGCSLLYTKYLHYVMLMLLVKWMHSLSMNLMTIPSRCLPLIELPLLK